jgi:hypothetical protein
MATVKRKRPVDYVGYEPVMLELSKARAMAWVLAELGAGRNNLRHALEDTGHPEETHERLKCVVADALRDAHDEIEREYRKLGTNLLAKEFAKGEIERLVRPDEPKDRA